MFLDFLSEIVAFHIGKLLLAFLALCILAFCSGYFLTEPEPKAWYTFQTSEMESLGMKWNEE